MVCLDNVTVALAYSFLQSEWNNLQIMHIYLKVYICVDLQAYEITV